ncbi:MAG: triosephosphate isomerase [Planctomycetes bacterium]|nr:triosephosphate isomerase [Planctomycetota bacterium]
MNSDLSSAVGFVEEFFKHISGIEGKIRELFDVVIFPQFPLIKPIVDSVEAGARWSDLLRVGAQDIQPEDRGAFTGAVNGICLKSVGVSSVIIGHSERRWFFGDSDSLVNAKLSTTINMNFEPVLCIGEPGEIRDKGEQDSFVLAQLETAFDSVKLDSISAISLAYEPVWSIGTGRNATEAEIAPMIELIRGFATKAGFPGGGANLRILYGGSVNPQNASELYSIDGVDGFLVGGASLDALSFSAILDAMAGEGE